MAITYDYYRIFYYVAKYKNFTQAAHVLLSSQPNVTRSMNNLESELGCRLFVRSNRGVTLTPEGERLYTRVASAHAQLQAAEEELSRERTMHTGTVSIGASETALHIFLLPILRDFHRKYPDIRIHIHNYSTPQAIASLRTGLVDFSVVATPTGASRPLKEIPLKTFREILVGGPQFADLSATPLRFADLPSYPLIFLNRQTKTFELFNQLFLKRGLSLKPDVEAATIDQILPLIKNDLGIGFLPEEFARPSLDAGEIFHISLDFEIPERTICLVKDINRPIGIAARELEKMVREAASEKDA
ncbi:MAG: LysR family transcriptional regulator [Lachnospiraceae bacterium]|nr:LysR family transcriptional regulator [Lachnospiraceae bacterium]